MEDARSSSRTPEGRAKLRSDEKFFATLNSILATNDTAKEVDNGVAALANLFSEDGANAVVLKLCIRHGHIFPGIIARLKSQSNFICCCVCMVNCWKQSVEHQEYLLKFGIVQALLSSVPSKQFGVQALGALRTLMDDLDLSKSSVSISDAELLPLYTAATLPDLSLTQRTSILKLLLSSDLLLASVVDTDERKSEFAAAIVNGLFAALKDGNDSAVAEVLHSLKECMEKCDWLLPALISRTDFLRLLKEILSSRKSQTSSVLIKAVSELSATVAQLAGDECFSQIFQLDLDELWLDVVVEASRHIPHQISQRVRDQSLVLPHAETRLSLLTALLHVSVSEPRARRLLLKHAHEVISDVAINYMEYDLDAVRSCVNILRNLTLADSRTVVLETRLTMLISTLLRTQDHHTAFICAGIFRTACARSGRADADSWARLVVNGEDLLSMLSLDLTRIHPHTRVELARAFAMLMESLGTFTGHVPALETVQAVKFVTFLLEAPQSELHLEALNGLSGLSSDFLKALPSFDIEIVPGTELVGRLKAIYATVKDSLEMKQLTVASSTRRLLQKMGVDID